MRKAVLMDQQDSVNRSPHAKLLILVPHALEPGRYARILLEQGVLGPEGVVGERVEVNSATEREGRILGVTCLA